MNEQIQLINYNKRHSEQGWRFVFAAIHSRIYYVGLPLHLVPGVIAGIKMGIRCKSGTIPVAVILYCLDVFPGNSFPGH